MDPSVSTHNVYLDSAKSDYKELISQVHASCTDNDELVAAVNARRARPGATISHNHLRARCVPADGKFRFLVTASVETTALSAFVTEWSPEDTTYIDISAEFPVGPDWNLDTFDKLAQANREVRDVATALGIARGSSESKQILVKLLRNATKMGNQLRQLFVLINRNDNTTGNTAAPTTTDDADDDDAEAIAVTETRARALQEELEGSVQSILRKYGAIAESEPIALTTPPAETPLATAELKLPAVATIAATPSNVQAAMSALGVLAEHRASLLQWISEARGAPYAENTLTLQYQASRDGWRSDDFRRMCNGQGSMLFIVCSDKGYLFGGYASVGFTQHTKAKDTDDSYAFARDDAAFLFTLTNPHGIAPAKYSCKRPEQALVNHRSGNSYPGLFFTNGFKLRSDCNTRTNSGVMLHPDWYDTPHGDNTFTGSGSGWTVAEVLGFRV